MKLFGYGRPLPITYRLSGHERRVVLHTATANEFGDENRADRAADLLLSYDTYNTLPRHVVALDVGIFCHISKDWLGDMADRAACIWQNDPYDLPHQELSICYAQVTLNIATPSGRLSSLPL